MWPWHVSTIALKTTHVSGGIVLLHGRITQPSITMKIYLFILMTQNLSRSSNHDLVIKPPPALPDSHCHMKKKLNNEHRATKSLFEEEQHTTSTPARKEGLKLCTLEQQAPSMTEILSDLSSPPKWYVKQGPVRSSKILKFTPKGNDE